MTERTILVVVEFNDGVVSETTMEVLTAAHEIAGDSGTVATVCIGPSFDDEQVLALTARGSQRVILIEDAIFAPFQADAWLNDLASLVSELKPECVLFSHSVAGIELAPRLAFRVNGAVVTACSAVSRVDDTIHWTRACYGGAFRQVVSLHALPMVATIATMAFEPAQAAEARTGQVVHRKASTTTQDIRARVIDVQPPGHGQQGAQLQNADVVVAGGRGLGGPEGFVLLGELAGELNAAVGASRVACDLGWCPHSRQVGLSGKTVAPRLYIAFGISGAPQHVAGCANAKSIVAINTDEKAEIFKLAKFGVVADCAEFIPALTAELRHRQASMRS
ncbi:electron transfer flavoprotein subunit alpha/FixB family protein [Pseudorhodoplanes sp.]|uniref:electron transfer flavoprotein subunit alpha/FixB family protein n=1 Tax=Pseudorhodoplanes sp. TaxID=1934341 RepID=UPI003D140957